MKVSRVSETFQVPEQDRSSRQEFRHPFSFRIEAPLETNGDATAAADERETPAATGWCHVVAQPFDCPHEEEDRLNGTLDSFLERMRRAHRIDLRM